MMNPWARMPQRPGRAVLCVFLTLIVPAAAGAGAAGAKKGKLEELSKHVAKVLKLTVSGKSLCLDRAHWAPPPAKPVNPVGPVQVRINVGGRNRSGVETAFRALQSAAGARSSSRSGWNDRVSVTFSGAGLYGRLNVQGGFIQVVLREEKGPKNNLDVSDDGLGSLRIVHSNSDGDILVLVQGGEGRLTVVHVVGDEMTGVKAESFRAFYRKNVAYVEEGLFPSLKRIGIGLPPGRFSPKVVQAVCGRLRPLAAEERAEYAKLIRGMDDEDFHRREAATKALSEAFARYAALVKETLKKPPSVEVKERLEGVLGAHADQQEVEEFVSSMGLLSDVGYLVQLTAKAAGADRVAAGRRLEKLTGQKLGSDPAAWKRWWEAKGKPK